MCRLLVQPLPRTPPGRQRKRLTSLARGARGGAGARVRGLRGQVRAHPSEQGEHAGEDRLPEATGDTDAGKQSHLLLSRQVLHCPTPLSGWGSGGDRK